MGIMQKSWIVKKLRTKKFVKFSKCKCDLKLFNDLSSLCLHVNFEIKSEILQKYKKMYTTDMVELSFLH